MPRDTANETPVTERVDVHSRLKITYRRVTKRAKPVEQADGSFIPGKPIEWVNESFNLVHNNRELGAMFKDNPDYVDVVYTKYEAAA